MPRIISKRQKFCKAAVERRILLKADISKEAKLGDDQIIKRSAPLHRWFIECVDNGGGRL